MRGKFRVSGFEFRVRSGGEATAIAAKEKRDAEAKPRLGTGGCILADKTSARLGEELSR
jgi:hypothetical protein